MVKLPILRLLLLVGIASGFSIPAADLSVGRINGNLAFDTLSKNYSAAVGEMTAEFDFSVTNNAATNITINSVRASCGCTTPKLPPLPWTLAPGKNGSFHVTVDLHGKAGTFQKSVFMDTTDGTKTVFVNVTMPTAVAAPGMDARARNMQAALADRQVIFKNDCATCHKPSPDLMGEKLFVSTCGICHEAEHRATSVPDLHASKAPPTEAYWEAWIRYGKVGTMMPAFSTENDGPLSDGQINSLVSFLSKDFPNRKVKTTAVKPFSPPPIRTFAAPSAVQRVPLQSAAPLPPAAPAP
jgi:mono/diheme cytochrome c family protein